MTEYLRNRWHFIRHYKTAGSFPYDYRLLQKFSRDSEGEEWR